MDHGSLQKIGSFSLASFEVDAFVGRTSHPSLVHLVRQGPPGPPQNKMTRFWADLGARPLKVSPSDSLPSPTSPLGEKELHIYIYTIQCVYIYTLYRKPVIPLHSAKTEPLTCSGGCQEPVTKHSHRLPPRTPDASPCPAMPSCSVPSKSSRNVRFAGSIFRG